MLLYAMGNAGHGMIARLFAVGEVAVFKWIRQKAAALPEPTGPAPEIAAEVEIAQLDEMWHVVEGKKQMLGLECLRSGQSANPLSRFRDLGFGSA